MEYKGIEYAVKLAINPLKEATLKGEYEWIERNYRATERAKRIAAYMKPYEDCLAAWKKQNPEHKTGDPLPEKLAAELTVDDADFEEATALHECPPGDFELFHKMQSFPIHVGNELAKSEPEAPKDLLYLIGFAILNGKNPVEFVAQCEKDQDSETPEASSTTDESTVSGSVG